MRAYHSVPWIEIGGGLFASVIFLLALLCADFPLVLSALDGAATLLGWRLMVGTDLTLAEAYAGAKGLPAEEAARISNDARQALTRLRGAVDALPSPDDTLRDIVDRATDILAQLQKEPEKLASCSRFLQVYLNGIAAVTEKFVALGKPSDVGRVNFADFLTNARAVCADQQRAIAADNVLDLDTEINVLTRRMRAEPTHAGVHHE